MANLSTIETRLQAIEETFSKLNHGTLTREELEELVVNTQELYERAIILRYKAFEEKIFGERPAESVPLVEAPIVSEPLVESIQEETHSSIPELEIDLEELLRNLLKKLKINQLLIFHCSTIQLSRSRKKY